MSEQQAMSRETSAAPGVGSGQEGGGQPTSGLRKDLREMPFEAQDALLRPGGAAVQRQAGFVEPPTVVRPTLRIGSSGASVVTLQERLNEVDGAGLAADGIFGPKTRAAVTSFQSTRGLMIDGIVGPQTWGALDETGAAADTPVTNIEDKAGSSLDSSLQALLAAVLRAAAEMLRGPGPDGAARMQEGTAPTTGSPLPEVFAAMSKTIESNALPADVAMSTVLTTISALSMSTGDPKATTAAATTRLQFDACVALSQALLGAPLLALLTPESRETPDLWRARLWQMTVFYRSLLPADDDEAAPAAERQEPVSGQRQAMVGLALAQVGKVKAKYPVPEGKDRPGYFLRSGWQTLEMIFSAAMNYEPFSPKHYGGPFVEWCGPFATWAAMNAGMPIDKWNGTDKVGSGVKKLFAKTRAPGHKPMPGDIVHRNPTHYGIITWVDREMAAKAKTEAELKAIPIRTVEGNTGTWSEILTHSGTIGGWNAGYRDVEGKAPAPP